MKKITLSIIASLIGMFGYAQNTYTVGAGGTYTTLKSAFEAINTTPVTADVTLQIISDLTETSNVGLVNNTTHTITITTDGKDRTVTFDDGGVLNPGPAGAICLGTTNALDWNLIPANNIIIDGGESNFTIITAATQNGFNGPISINGACDNVKIQNCIITHNGVAGTLGDYNIVAIALRTATDVDAGGNIMPSNTTISNCQITANAYPRAIAIASFSSLKSGTNTMLDGLGASSSTPSTLLDGLTVTDNILRVQRAGVMAHFINGGSVLIDKNEFYINQTASLLSWGVFIDNANNKIAPSNPPLSDMTVISNNKFLELKVFSTSTEPGLSVAGVEAIHVGNRSYSFIYNNIITGFDKTNSGDHLVKFRGVYAGSGTYDHGVLFYHNTIVLNALTNKPAFIANPKSGNNDAVYAAITLGGYTYDNAMDIKNNIFISKEDACYNFLLHESGTGSLNRAARSTSDYNVMHLAGNTYARFLYNAYENKTCVSYNDYFSYVVPMDANGIYAPVTFVKEAADGTADLHLATPDVNLEVPLLTSVTGDIDGENRTNPTFAGADHYSVLSSLTGLSVRDFNIEYTSSEIKVTFSGERTLELFTINGSLVEKTQAINEYRRNLNKGIYVLKVAGKAVKIII